MKDLDPTMDAFRLHDERGLPLTVSMAAAHQRSLRINLAAFACDALNALWPEERLRATFQEACADNGVPFDWTEFRFRLAALWTATKPHGESAFADMKRHLVETPDRT